MNRLALTISLGAAMTVAALHAENPMSSEAKASFQPISSNILKAAEKMPESDYSFKPTPDVRTFAELIAHVAEAQKAICGVAKGEPMRRDTIAKTAKADLIEALKASNDYCIAVYTAMNDEEGTTIVKTPFGTKPKLGVLNFNVAHDNETYGTIAVYLRLKGIVPPSSSKD